MFAAKAKNEKKQKCFVKRKKIKESILFELIPESHKELQMNGQ